MNLWFLLPDALLDIKGILYLPYLVCPSYLVCVIVFIKLDNKLQEAMFFGIFILLTIVASSVMLLSLGPKIGKLIPPGLLICVMLLPLLMTLKRRLSIDSKAMYFWLCASLAGVLHSISWGVWLMALARS